jgi:hypothetical protein
MLKGDDGYVWKRALVTSQGKSLDLEEGKPVHVYGIAEPNSLLQAFVFNYTDTDPDPHTESIQPPGNGLCVEPTPTNANGEGRFSFEYDSSGLFANLGEKEVIDVFYKTDILWERFLEAYKKDNQNVFIGSSVRPKVVYITSSSSSQEIEEDESLENCSVLCANNTADSKTLEGVVLSSGGLSIDFLHNLKGFNEVTIGRFPGKHTFYTKGDGGGNTDDLRYVAHRAIGMEILKRRLLGIESAGGTAPGLSDITEDILLEAFEGNGGSSDETIELVRNIMAALVSQTNVNAAGPGNPPTFPSSPIIPIERSSAISYLDPIINQPTDVLYKDLNLTEDMFPVGVSTNETWALDFVDMMNFWTGKKSKNTCLLGTTTALSDNFHFSDTYSGVPMANQCDFIYVSGISPTILLHREDPIMLSPDFSDISIVRAERKFTSNESWEFPEGEKEFLSYKYSAYVPFDIRFLGESCLKAEDILEYSEHIAEHFVLSDREKSVVLFELNQALGKSSEYFQVRVAHPDDIAKRFIWRGNGEELSIFQLFFEPRSGMCSHKDFGNFSPFSFSDKGRDGFEAGLLSW